MSRSGQRSPPTASRPLSSLISTVKDQSSAQAEDGHLRPVLQDIENNLLIRNFRMDRTPQTSLPKRISSTKKFLIRSCTRRAIHGPQIPSENPISASHSWTGSDIQHDFFLGQLLLEFANLLFDKYRRPRPCSAIKEDDTIQAVSEFGGEDSFHRFRNGAAADPPFAESDLGLPDFPGAGIGGHNDNHVAEIPLSDRCCPSGLHNP